MKGVFLVEKKHIKEHIENLLKRIDSAVKQYEDVYYDEESMANDALDYAKDVMMLQDRLIKALLTSERNITKLLEDIEQFEADMLTDDEVWKTEDDMPKFTREFYDRWIELQNKRNKLLGHDLEKAKTFDKIQNNNY